MSRLGNFCVFWDCAFIAKIIATRKITSSIYCYGNCTGIAKLIPECNVCLTFVQNFPLAKIITFTVFLGNWQGHSDSNLKLRDIVT